MGRTTANTWQIKSCGNRKRSTSSENERQRHYWVRWRIKKEKRRPFQRKNSIFSRNCSENTVHFGFKSDLNTVVFHFKAAFWVTRYLKTGLKLENFWLRSDDSTKK